MYSKSCFIFKVKGTQTKDGYRQLGLIGNSISTHAYRKCRDLLEGNGKVLWNCMFTNDESNQENITTSLNTMTTTNDARTANGVEMMKWFMMKI